MIFLLVVATLLAPVLALVVAEKMRESRRRKAKAATVEEDQGNG